MARNPQQEGKAETKWEIAERMLFAGIPLKEIKAATLLSLTQIQALAKEKQIENQELHKAYDLQVVKQEMFASLFRDVKRLQSLYDALGSRQKPARKLFMEELPVWPYDFPYHDTMLFFTAQHERVEDFEAVALIAEEDVWHPNNLHEMLFFLLYHLHHLLGREAFGAREVHILPCKCCYFYRGGRKEPFHQEHSMQEVTIASHASALNLVVDTYNLGNEKENELLNACPELKAYEHFSQKLEEYVLDGKTVVTASGRAADSCIEENDLPEFFLKWKKDVWAWEN